MIDDEIMNRICPLPNEENEMQSIKEELKQEGFIINNFNKGGIFYMIIRIFVLIYIELISLSRKIINSSFIKHAEDDWLIIKAADFGKTLKEPVKAKGYITIYRDNYTNALQVSKGHMFKTEPDVNGKELKYYALETTVINAGEETGLILVEAEEPGTDYNVSAGKITVSMIHLDGVSDITNESDWIYEEGADGEELESLRKRVEGSWDELAERTTEGKLKNAAMSVSGVLSVQINAQHPRGQGTTDIIVTSTNGEATDELLKKVADATEYLKGNYDDFLYKSSTIVNTDIALTIYISKDANTDGIDESAKCLIENMMKISNREEMNCLYLDDIRYVLKNSIPSYKRAVITSPESDIELETGNVIMLGSLSVRVKNVGGA